MQFRTQIPISRSDRPIGYESKVVSLGSCFAVNMAQKFDYFQIRNRVNPFGILFHPLAIERLVRFALTAKTFTESDVVEHGERWHCFDAHSDLSDTGREKLLRKLDEAVTATRADLSQATHLILTYGTAWVYRANATGAPVANCHKIPQAQFTKEILSVGQIGESIRNTIEMARLINPNLQIILTISPVRHLKDGFVENQRAKSNLIAALHEVLPDAGCVYFPSYEIMMDELRDYRFYAADMLHPSQIAIDYLWERFVAGHLCEQALPVMEKVAQVRKGLEHRPFNPNSQSHRRFEETLQDAMAALHGQYPHIRF